MGAGISCCNGMREDKMLVTKLDLSHCGCTEVPNIVFNAERCIETLNLSSNQITSLPPQLFHCQELKHVNLIDNCLDALPPAIGSLLNLVSLKLDKNNLRDIPDSLKACRKLKRLSLTHNPWKQLPAVVTQLITLEELYLNDCELGYLPASVGRLSKLKILELRNNNLCSLPLSLSRLSVLARLDVGDNELTEFPPCVASLEGLTELLIDNNDIELLTSLDNLARLEHLDASYNHLTTVSDSVGACTNLIMLNLSFNYIEALPDSIGSLVRLQTLLLEMNELTEVPRSLGQLSGLEDLNLSNNRLYNIPNSIGLLRNLTNLNLVKNIIEELPSEIGSCVSLSVINLGYNRLQVLPSEIGYLNNLRVLDLVGNFLTYLPMTMMKLGGIRAIWLSANQNVPLIPFTEDLDLANGERFLTNIALPQLGEIPLVHQDQDGEKDKAASWTKKIRFAEDDDILPGKLHRTPTPFPKELRAPNRKQHTRSASGDNYVDCAALGQVGGGGGDGAGDEGSVLLAATNPRADMLNFTEGACVSRIREASIVKNRDKEPGAAEDAADRDRPSPLDAGDMVQRRAQSGTEPNMPATGEVPGEGMDREPHCEADGPKRPPPPQDGPRTDYVIYSNLIDERGGTMDPQSVREMYHNDVIYDGRRFSTANSDTYGSQVPSRNGFYEPGTEPKYGSVENGRTWSESGGVEMQRLDGLHNGNPAVDGGPGPLDNDARRFDYVLVYPQTENGNGLEMERRSRPDLLRQSPGPNANLRPRPDLQPFHNGNPRYPYEAPPLRQSPRPPDKQEQASLTERMRSRNIEPPCYEIAKMYSTKAALFERHHQQQQQQQQQ